MAAVLHGKATLEEAIERTAMSTRRLAKRQETWFRSFLEQGAQRIGLRQDSGRTLSRTRRRDQQTSIAARFVKTKESRTQKQEGTRKSVPSVNQLTA